MPRTRLLCATSLAVAALAILASHAEAGHFYRLHYHAAIQGRQQQCVQAQEHGCLATLEAWDMGQDDGKVTFCGPLRLLNVCVPKRCWHCDGACGGNVVSADVWQIGGRTS